MQEERKTRWVNNKAYQFKIEYQPAVYVKAPNIWIDEHLDLTIWFEGEVVYHNRGFRNPEEAHYELNQYFEVMETRSCKLAKN